jgi:plasmid stabilization system protein ParE
LGGRQKASCGSSPIRIKISGGAERDIEKGCDFYEDIDPNLAAYFYDSIAADIDSLLLYAGVHAKSDGLHFTFASRFPFVIWYGIIKDIVVVYAVLDGRRDPERNAKALRQRRLKNE